MTIKNLQDELIEEVEKVLSEVQTSNSDDETVAGVTGYAHRLPITQSDEDDPAQYFPYFIVRFDTGQTEDDEDWWHITTSILLGVYDDGIREKGTGEETDKTTARADGNDSILIMIQRIIDRFTFDPALGAVYRADQKIDWAVGDDDTYPYYFGAVSITFSAPKIGRREYDV